jgi:hypothetical protein
VKKIIVVTLMTLLSLVSYSQTYRGFSSNSAPTGIRTGLIVGGSGILIMGLATPAEYSLSGVKTPLVQQTNKFAAITVGGGMVFVGCITYLFERRR